MNIRMFGQSYTVLNKPYDNTITVLQQDETTPPGPFNPALEVQIRTYGLKYMQKILVLFTKNSVLELAKKPCSAKIPGW
jgi:hypothetical protein